MNVSVEPTEASEPKLQPAATAAGGGEFWTIGRFALFLTAALLAAFPTIALGTRTFFYRDFGAMWYPVNLYTRESLLSGRIPLWNPYIHCGVPFQAQMGQWYPPLLGALILPMPWSIGVLLLAHLLWAGLGMFWLSRRLGASPFAASFAGMAFVFNGVMLSSLLWTSYIACLAWLPWVIGCVVESWSKGGRWLVLATLCSAMQVLTGMPELTALTWLFLAALWVNALVRREILFVPSTVRTAGIILLAAGITMIQMLPFFDLISHSQRNTSYATDTWSMPIWGLANLLVPLFHCYKSAQGTWFQAGQDLLPSYYLGVSVLVLAATALLLSRKRFIWAFLGMLIFCWLMAPGPHGGMYSWLRRAIPALGFARYPAKLMIFPAFLVPVMAAWAVHSVQAEPGTKARRYLVTTTSLALILMGALLWSSKVYPMAQDNWDSTAWNTLWRAILAVAIIAALLFLNRMESGVSRVCLQVAVLALLAIDALSHSPNIAPTLPSSAMAPGMWEASGKPVPPKLGEGRIMLSAQAEKLFVNSYVTNLDQDFALKRIGEWYDLNLLDHVPKVNGAIPLHPGHYDFLENHLYYKSNAKYGAALLDFLSVAWYLTADKSVEWVALTNHLPMLTAGQQPVFVNDEQALEAITADTFQPRKAVYLPEAARPSITVTNATTCEIMNMRFLPERVEADIVAASATMAVMSQTYYHLWNAYVDGNPVPLFRANVAFQAFQVPAGKHHIEVVYRDHNLSMGALLTAISFAVCGLLWYKFRDAPLKPRDS